MVASTLLVQQDLSGTAFGGTFVPTDVTRFVRLVDGVSINSWRQDAMAQVSPSTLSLTFDNDAIPGDATAPNAGRFTPGLSSSPWSGKILPGVRTRVTETVGGTTYQLFDGYVLDWTAQPGGDDGTFPVVQVSCTDVLGWLGTLQPLYSIVVEEMLLDSPRSLYPLDEAAGSSSAGDLTGTAPAAKVKTSKYGAGTLAFGAQTTVFGQSGAMSMSSPSSGSATSAAKATYLSIPNAAIPASGGWSMEWWFVGPAAPPSNIEYLFNLPAASGGSIGPGATFVYINNTGLGGTVHYGIYDGQGLAFIILDGTAVVADGQPHHLVLELSADNKTLTAYIDGVLDATQTVGTSLNWAKPTTDASLGLHINGQSVDFPLTGQFNLWASYPTPLSSARVAAHHQAGIDAFAGERTDTHAARLLGYRPNLGSVLDVGKGTVGPHATAGLSVTQALMDTGKAEGGLVFADGQGRIVLLNRAHLYNPVIAATFDAEADLTSDYQARVDTQLLVNDMTVNRPGGPDQRVVDATSKSTYGWRQQSDTYIVNSDRDADDAAGWLVALMKAAVVRTPSIAIDITTMTSTSQAQAAMARQPLDRVTLSNLPTWAPPTDVLVQGRTVRIDDKGLSVAFFTSNLPPGTLRADGSASARTRLDSGLKIPW